MEDIQKILIEDIQFATEAAEENPNNNLKNYKILLQREGNEFSMSSVDKTRSNWLKFRQGRFRFNIKKNALMERTAKH